MKKARIGKRSKSTVKSTPAKWKVLARKRSHAKAGNRRTGAIIKRKGAKGTGGLGGRIKELKVEKQRLEQESTTLQQAIQENRGLLEEQKSLLNEVEVLARSGLRVEEVEKVRAKVGEVAERRNLDREQAFRAFLDDLDSFDAILGFRNVLEALKSSEDAKTQRIAELDTKLNDLEQRYGAKEKILGALASLLEKGASEQQILQIKDALDASDINVQDLGEQLVQYGGLTKRNESLKSEEKKLGGQISQLRTELNDLNESKTQMQSTMTMLNSEILSRMEAVKSKADEVKNVTETDLNNASERIRALVGELLKQVEKTSQDTITVASSSAQAVKQEIEAAREMAKQDIFGMDDLHSQAVTLCRAYLGKAFEEAPIEQKRVYVMHYENILALLKKGRG